MHQIKWRLFSQFGNHLNEFKQIPRAMSLTRLTNFNLSWIVKSPYNTFLIKWDSKVETPLNLVRKKLEKHRNDNHLSISISILIFTYIPIFWCFQSFFFFKAHRMWQIYTWDNRRLHNKTRQKKKGLGMRLTEPDSLQRVEEDEVDCPRQTNMFTLS